MASIQDCNAEFSNIPKLLFSENIGKTFVVEHFLSTSIINWNNSKIIWKIKTHNSESKGKKIKCFTDQTIELRNNGEREVLFERNSSFKIISVKKINKDGYLIELEEVKYKMIDLTFKNSLLFT